MTRPLLPPDRLPLLITGVTGVTGYNAFPYFRKRYGEQVIGIRPAVNWRLNGPGIFGVDPQDLDSLKQLFREFRFRSVLNCGGNCALKACELNPEMAYRINVEATKNLAEMVAGTDTRFIHLSSDLVFSGVGSGAYTEEDRPDPVSMYGKTMALSEEVVFAARPDALVARISLPMGESFNGHAGAIDWIANRFKNDRPATLYFDEVRTPTYVEDMNRVLERLLASDLSGLFHFGGPRAITLYQIAQVVNRVGGFQPHLLKGCPRIEAGPIPPRAGNVSMNSTKLAAALGDSALFRPWPYDDGLFPTDRSWHRERPNHHPAGPEAIRGLLYNVPVNGWLALSAR